MRSLNVSGSRPIVSTIFPGGWGLWCAVITNLCRPHTTDISGTNGRNQKHPPPFINQSSITRRNTKIDI